MVFSVDKVAYCRNEGKNAVVESDDCDYFYNFFDFDRDYSKIVKAAENEKIDALTIAAREGKGIRILNQDSFEALFSFMVSQNNNIPRIKKIIEKTCEEAGENRRVVFDGQEVTFNTFPSIERLSAKKEDFFKQAGYGYRSSFVQGFVDAVKSGLNLEEYKKLPTEDLRKKLLKIRGVGEKVADCALLFGFHRSDSFPVDTWIEKVYVEDLNGKEKDRKKIASELVDRFKENSGYYQQYLFYRKRSLSK